MKKILSAAIVCILLFSLTGMALATDFSDVDSSHKYYEEIQFCQAKNYITGSSATMFEPDANLTRGQLAAILCRTQLLQSLPIDVSQGNFNDIVPLKNYYDAAAIIMGSLGFIKGTSDNIFSPNEFVTREQLAAIIMRMLRLGADNEDAYMVYSDYASISDYATTAVSACLNNDIFVGLYENEMFMPQAPVTRAEICKLIYTVDQPSHTITIAAMTGGTVTASASTAKAGKVITLTVVPDAGERLIEGTLKYNTTIINGMTFIMPDEDVTIYAEFETVPALQSIGVTKMPTKIRYTAGDTLDLSGMEVKAVFSNSTTAIVTDYTTDPANGTTLASTGAIPVTVSYTQDGVTKTTTFSVTVIAAAG